MRHRKTDAHIATIRVSVPIDLMDHLTVLNASAAINGLSAHLPPGSTVEVLNSRFGRVDAPVVVPAPPTPQTDMMQALREAVASSPALVPATQLDIEHALAAVREQVTASAVDPLEPPESLRRVPRPAPNGA